MIQELAEFGKRITKGKNRALKEEKCSFILVINKQGDFVKFIPVDKKFETAVITEYDKKKGQIGTIRAKKGHARFLLDNPEEVLGIGDEKSKDKHRSFLLLLSRYKDVEALQPVFNFYSDNHKNGLSKAKEQFIAIPEKDRKGNITFSVGTNVLLETEEVKYAVIKLFYDDEKRLLNGRVCSVCGSSNSPVLDEPHGLVKMPKGQTAGSALISYNTPAFESYGLKGNLNSSICRECARNYIEGLTFLLSDGHQIDDGKKAYFHYNHRIKISDSTIAVFWTKKETEEINPFIIYDKPDEEEVKSLFNSVWNGNSNIGDVVDSNMFYSCTLSSAAARIAVRDWTAISIDTYKENIAQWFNDIEIENNDGKLTYCPLGLLVIATQRDKRTGDKQSSDTNSKSRIGTILWNAAIKGRVYKIPLEVLLYVLNRIFLGDEFTPSRAAIIKLFINRNTNKKMSSNLDETNKSIAFLCGRLFAIIESMQWKAIGDVNSGVKERYFAAAVSQPAYILGTLLTKNVPIYQHKIGGYLAKDLNEIAGIISESGSFPQRFLPVEKGEFALGYYFQRTHNKMKSNKSDNNL